MSLGRSNRRLIVHADMDAFYAAVEQLDDPTLRGRPLLIGPPGPRGVVLTASYEARPFGVGSAMPMVEARRRCPQALVVPPRFERYRDVSREVMAVFRRFSPTIEPLSLDEAFIDMTGAEQLFGSPESIGRRLKQDVNDATGLTVSVGISATKYVAKVASAHRKPDGLTIVPEETAREWLAPLPLERLWGAGPRTAAKLRAVGLCTLGDVAAAGAERLVATLGQQGRNLHALACGHDPRIVEGTRTAKSIGSELTLSTDTQSLREVRLHLRREADQVARRLRKAQLAACGLRVKLKRHDFRLLSRQRQLAAPTDVADELFRAALELLPGFEPLPRVRLVGLAAFDLVPFSDRAPDLLADRHRARDLELALDALSNRFGEGIVIRAADLVGDRGVGGGSGSELDFLRDD